MGTQKVLVLVKASPQPSRQYGDTVCVAGICADAVAPRWVRLYPVPFRYLDGDNQFRKYDVISVNTRDAGSDKRPESRKIEATSIRVEQQVKGWQERAKRVEMLHDPSMCDLQDAVKKNIDSQSLAAVRPTEVNGLKITPHPGWTAEQLARFDAYRDQGDLFRETAPRLLDPPRFEVRIDYMCETLACSGHVQRIIDWELTALQRRYLGRPDEELRAAITRNFREIPFAKDRAPRILVGNQENVQRRASFTVLGLYYPRRSDLFSTAPLFPL